MPVLCHKYKDMPKISLFYNYDMGLVTHFAVEGEYLIVARALFGVPFDSRTISLLIQHKFWLIANHEIDSVIAGLREKGYR